MTATVAEDDQLMDKRKTEDDELLDKHEVGKILRRHPETVVRWGRSGKLPGSQPGGNGWRWRRGDVRQFIADGIPSAPERSQSQPSRNPKYATTGK